MLPDFFASQLFQGIAGGASIISVIWAVSSLRIRASKKIFLSKKSHLIVCPDRLMNFSSEQSKVLRTGGPVSVSYFLILNKSSRSITDSDFIEKPEIKSEKSTKIIEAIVVNDPTVRSCTLRHEQDSVLIYDLLLKPADGTVVAVLYSGRQEPVLIGSTPTQASLVPTKLRFAKLVTAISRCEFPALFGLLYSPFVAILILYQVVRFTERKGLSISIPDPILLALIFFIPVLWVITKASSAYIEKKKVEYFWINTLNNDRQYLDVFH